jgi:pyruvate formate lyase activating enzyme
MNREMNEGIIFDIKKYAIHDGPGIRTTVFLKGCPLNCWWCHNPESQKTESEIMLYTDRCILSCNLCVERCPQKAIKKNGNIIINRKFCDSCGECEDICPSEAIKISGKKITVNYIMEEIEKDTLFYDESSGGITISGGEPMLQIDFLEQILKESKERYLTTVVDTSGYIDFSYFKRINDFVDLFFYDIKLMNDNLHKKYTGVSNKLILENLIKLSEIHNNIEVRIPLIEGITDTEENIKLIMGFLKKIKGIKKISLLNYHKGGIAKYDRLGIKYKLQNIRPLSDEKILKIKEYFEKQGFIVKIGG